jgi:replication-associated recombination protein RarA
VKKKAKKLFFRKDSEKTFRKKTEAFFNFLMACELSRRNTHEGAALYFDVITKRFC